MKTFLLGDICKIEIGRTPARANPLFWGGKHPWLSISDMGKCRDIHTTKEGITDLGTETFNGRIVKPGTLLFSFKLSIGKIGIARVPLYTNEAIAALHIKDRLLACEEYLYYALQGLNFDTETDRAVMGKTLNKKKLAQINIPLPPLEEQKRIAAILDKADAVRRSRQKAIRLTEELLRSTFLDMFGDPVTNPKEWDKKLLIELIDTKRPITYGILKPGEDIPHGIPYVRVVDMKNGTIEVLTVRRTTKEIATQYKRSTLHTNDLLLSIRGHVGRLAIVPEELNYANITQDTARLAVGDALTSEYLFSLLESHQMQHWMKNRTKGAGVKGINLADVKEMPILIPPRRLQDQYTRMFKTIRSHQKHNRDSTIWFNNLFNSLLQKAFRGEL